MDPHDAQKALDDIDRLKGTTRELIVRQSFALPYTLIAAAGLFTGFVGTDFAAPWNWIVLVSGLLVYVVAGIVHERRALARRRPGTAEMMLYSGWLLGLCLIFGVGRMLAFAVLDLPAGGLLSQATVGALVVALAYLATAPLIRLAVAAIMRREG
ncbi:hypothetical protein [Nonomuraea typhae]|uniref:Uncharacterized protein n=1 Tax=Nonomuraea typhae TaxID=2603600 RepID=A0ABW7YYP1_9ACTN